MSTLEKKVSLPRYGEVRSLEVVHGGGTEPRPGGAVKPPALTHLAGPPMRRELIRTSTNPQTKLNQQHICSL